MPEADNVPVSKSRRADLRSDPAEHGDHPAEDAGLVTEDRRAGWCGISQ
jgi:hypothetical protein